LYERKVICTGCIVVVAFERPFVGFENMLLDTLFVVVVEHATFVVAEKP
jgi:hypothetical protein